MGRSALDYLKQNKDEYDDKTARHSLLIPITEHGDGTPHGMRYDEMVKKESQMLASTLCVDELVGFGKAQTS